MSSEDEYDAFYPPIDPAALAEIEDLAPHTLPGVIVSLPVYVYSPAAVRPRNSSTRTRTPPSPDEFDAYFSGFTAEDFAEIDASAVAAHAAMSPPLPEAGTGASTPGGASAGPGAGGGARHGGPRIEIAVERARNADPSPRVKATRPRRSPYEEFRGSRGQLSVTDLTGPSW